MLEDYDIGNVNLIPIDGVNEQQLINDIIAPSEPHTPDNSVDDLIQDLDDMQDEIDKELEQIQSIAHPRDSDTDLRRSSQATRGQRQNLRYEKEYKLLNTHKSSQ